MVKKILNFKFYLVLGQEIKIYDLRLQKASISTTIPSSRGLTFLFRSLSWPDRHCEPTGVTVQEEDCSTAASSGFPENRVRGIRALAEPPMASNHTHCPHLRLLRAGVLSKESGRAAHPDH